MLLQLSNGWNWEVVLAAPAVRNQSSWDALTGLR